MDKETWDFLNVLYLSEKASLDNQIEEKIRDEFSEEERRVHDALVHQKWNAENSPAYGSVGSKDKAMTSAEVAYNHGNSLIYAKIDLRKNELNKQADQGLDKIYLYDGGSRKQAELDHKDWLTEQAKKRTSHDDPNRDSRQITQKEKYTEKTKSFQTEFNDHISTVKKSTNEKVANPVERIDVDLEK